MVDIISELQTYNTDITICDPWVDVAKQEYDLTVLSQIPNGKFDVIIIAVAHDEFSDIHLNSFMAEKCVLYDVKSLIKNRRIIDGRL